jgi:magnesium transporter
MKNSHLKTSAGRMVKRLTKRHSKKVGLPPGSMIHVGEKKVEKVSISVLDYDEQHLEAKTLEKVEQAFPFKALPTVTWLNITGLHEVDILEKIGKFYEINPLILEDILNTDQRPKIEFFDDYVFAVLKMIMYDDVNKELQIEQVSLIMGENYVITFQERDGDIFDSLRERIRAGKGRIRKSGPDYLMYAMMDLIVDHYFIILEKIGELIEDLEAKVIENPNRSEAQQIQGLKRELILLRKSIWPLREVVSSLMREEHPLLHESMIPFLQDLYDHTIQVVETVETFRDMMSGILDIYLSSISNRMNEVMKVLTIIATIFIPLTFIAGVYGMNFRYMPELGWRWGYPASLLLMVIVSLGMLFYFRRKRWL